MIHELNPKVFIINKNNSLILVITLFEYIINEVRLLIRLALVDKLLDPLESELLRVELHLSIALVLLQIDFGEELLGESGRKDKESNYFLVSEAGTHYLC